MYVFPWRHTAVPGTTSTFCKSPTSSSFGADATEIRAPSYPELDSSKARHAVHSSCQPDDVPTPRGAAPVLYRMHTLANFVSPWGTDSLPNAARRMIANRAIDVAKVVFPSFIRQWHWSHVGLMCLNDQDHADSSILAAGCRSFYLARRLGLLILLHLIGSSRGMTRFHLQKRILIYS